MITLISVTVFCLIAQIPSNLFKNIIGTVGNDDLLGINQYHESIFGLEGNDTLDGGGCLGRDTLTGGLGNDVYYFNCLNTQIREFANQGIDTVYSSVDWKGVDHIEKVILTEKATNANGNNVPITIVGNERNNYIKGGLSNDNLMGGNGDDTLYGYVGSDTLTGGLGRDVFNLAIDNNGLEVIDTITDYVPNEDVIKIKSNNPVTYAVVNSDKEVEYSTANVVFSLQSNVLFFNPNKEAKGLANVVKKGNSYFRESGGKLAKLNKTPIITDISNW